MAGPFTEIPQEKWLYDNEHFFIIEDNYPVSPGHLLIIAKSGQPDFFSLASHEQKLLPETINAAKAIIERAYQPDGYNIGMNCGEAAGQTIFHFHCHVIPRFKGDMENPRGASGIAFRARGIIDDFLHHQCKGQVKTNVINAQNTPPNAPQ